MTGARVAPSHNNRVPPALTAFAPENTARGARRVGTLETLDVIVEGRVAGNSRQWLLLRNASSEAQLRQSCIGMTDMRHHVGVRQS